MLFSYPSQVFDECKIYDSEVLETSHPTYFVLRDKLTVTIHSPLNSHRLTASWPCLRISNTVQCDRNLANISEEPNCSICLEDGANIFLRNVFQLLQDKTASRPRTRRCSITRTQNLVIMAPLFFPGY